MLAGGSSQPQGQEEAEASRPRRTAWDSSARWGSPFARWGSPLAAGQVGQPPRSPAGPAATARRTAGWGAPLSGQSRPRRGGEGAGVVSSSRRLGMGPGLPFPRKRWKTAVSVGAESRHGLCGSGAGPALSCGNASWAPGEWARPRRGLGKLSLFVLTQQLPPEGVPEDWAARGALAQARVCSVQPVLCPAPPSGALLAPQCSEGTGRLGNLRAPSPERGPLSYPGLTGAQALHSTGIRASQGLGRKQPDQVPGDP